jgi:MoxR-like ATPase
VTANMGLPAATTTAHSEAVLDAIGHAVVGKRAALMLILTTVLAGGHVLIEDLPGLGKTLIARSFAAALGLDFTRVQFTPDLLPADLLGSTVYDMQSGRFEFRRGPIFTNLLLADEINRTPPKTQAALLEAMGEGQVSIDGVTHKLPAPFIVLATDNPIEYEGTYPLPEAQLDRFTIRLELRYLSEQDEESMLRRRLERGSAQPTVNQVVDAHDLLAMRESVEQVTVHDDAPTPAGRRGCQPALGTRLGATLTRKGVVARQGLRHTRGRQIACRSCHVTPDQPATGDVGAACARVRRSGGTVASTAGASNEQRQGLTA